MKTLWLLARGAALIWLGSSLAGPVGAVLGAALATGLRGGTDAPDAGRAAADRALAQDARALANRRNREDAQRELAHRRLVRDLRN